MRPALRKGTPFSVVIFRLKIRASLSFLLVLARELLSKLQGGSCLKRWWPTTSAAKLRPSLPDRIHSFLAQEVRRKAHVPPWAWYHVTQKVSLRRLCIATSASGLFVESNTQSGEKRKERGSPSSLVQLFASPLPLPDVRHHGKG